MVAGAGVGYGWQPMSDGSARYEYLVQVEPEMLDALRGDQAIPIVRLVFPDGVICCVVRRSAEKSLVKG